MTKEKFPDQQFEEIWPPKVDEQTEEKLDEFFDTPKFVDPLSDMLGPFPMDTTGDAKSVFDEMIDSGVRPTDGFLDSETGFTR